ncbi:MAG: HAD-superfamily hydrolase, subfamily variant 1 [Acidimicrobiales bacterium]|nr:HAD-superfamily hydrolase, subfamily variant 1 [Acidimicrobiales bacterium]
MFDWGGTLSEFVSAELVDAWRLAARHLAPDREDEITAVLVEVESDFWSTVATHQESTTLAALVAEASRRLGMDVGEALLEEAAVRHLDAWTPHITHDADAAPVLTALRDRGLRIGLLSNTHWPRSFHERFLERDGLTKLIDVRLYTSEMSHQKPHPSVFHAALDALHVDDPASAVFVGDRPFDDIGGASAVGMRTILRRNPAVTDPGPDADATIDRLPELLPIVSGQRRRIVPFIP